MPNIIIPILVAASIALIIYALWPAGEEKQERLKRRMAGGKVKNDVVDLRQKARESVTKKMMQKVAPIAVKPVMPKDSADMSKLRQKLCSAGMRQENASTLFLTSKTVLAVLGAFAGVAYSLAKGQNMVDGAGTVMFCAAIGLLAPNFWLSSVSAKRKEKVKHGLADTLDLMVVAVEAGLGLDAAIQRVSDELAGVHPELSEELQIAILETQMGIPRSEALDNLTNRTMVDEVRSVIAMINQAERFGTSIASALRTQANTLRMKRRQAAEARAAQCAVKLMAPLILLSSPHSWLFWSDRPL